MHLWEALVESDSGSMLHAWNGHEFEHHSWADVVALAHEMAVGLRRAGVGPGTRVAAILTNDRFVVAGVLGVWMAGGAVVSLPIPARGMDGQEYGRQLTLLCDHAQAPLLLVDEILEAAVSEPLGGTVEVRTWRSLPVSGRLDPCPPEMDEVAFIQYSSGSTSAPKGCMLSPRAIGEQLEIIASMSEAVPGEEVVATWLPLSHDMGLFGTLLYSWAWGFELVMSTPRRFMTSPRTWFRDCADFGATLTVATNTALDHAVRFQGRARLDRALRLKVCVIGAERVRWSTLMAAVDTFGPYGLEPRTFMPAYGLAEATLAVSAIGVAEEPKTAVVDAVALAHGEVRPLEPTDPRATRVVSVGPPCKGVEVRTIGSDPVSEIFIRSPSLASGYFGDPERSTARFVDGGFRTGDLGFIEAGELYAVGRFDDMICVGGRNVYAHEIEAEICKLPNVRDGCCTIVDLSEGRDERLVVLLEMNKRRLDFEASARSIASIATSKAGVDLGECMFLPKGTLPKTPSGKVQRFRCRQILRVGGFDSVAHVRLRD